MTGYDDIQTAAIIHYPYLWSRDAAKGETEGRKERPVAVGSRIPRPDGDLALFFQSQRNSRKRGVSLLRYRSSKSVVPVLIPNFVSGSSWTSSTAMSSGVPLEPAPPIGQFSKEFFLPILREFIARRKSFTEVCHFR